MIRPRGFRMKPTLKYRSFQSGWRALAWAMMKALYSRAIFPSSSVSSPGMSIAHSRAKVAWSRSSTSSLNAWRAPSGKAIKRTGMDKLDSHAAALTRWWRCSRLILMSRRSGIPRPGGMGPPAMYGLIIRRPSRAGAVVDARAAGARRRATGPRPLCTPPRRPCQPRARRDLVTPPVFAHQRAVGLHGVDGCGLDPGELEAHRLAFDATADAPPSPQPDPERSASPRLHFDDLGGSASGPFD